MARTAVPVPDRPRRRTAIVAIGLCVAIYCALVGTVTAAPFRQETGPGPSDEAQLRDCLTQQDAFREYLGTDGIAPPDASGFDLGPYVHVHRTSHAFTLGTTTTNLGDEITPSNQWMGPVASEGQVLATLIVSYDPDDKRFSCTGLVEPEVAAALDDFAPGDVLITETWTFATFVKSGNTIAPLDEMARSLYPEPITLEAYQQSIAQRFPASNAGLDGGGGALSTSAPPVEGAADEGGRKLLTPPSRV